MTTHRPLSRRRFIGLAAGSALALRSRSGLAATAPGDMTVVFPRRAGAPLQLAARELQQYLGRMTGRPPRLTEASADAPRPAVAVAGSTADDLGALVRGTGRLPAAGSDGFHIRTTAGVAAVVGGSERAVLFGVYDYLERLGCRWFAPLEEHVPAVGAKLPAVVDVRAEPGFRWRGLELIAGSDPAVVDWMAKAKLNVAWPEKYVPRPDLTESPDDLRYAAVPAMRERGLTIFWGGHVLPFLFPEARYADHPEYFAEIKGKRLNPAVTDPMARGQLCTSNPDAVRVLAANTVRFLRHHPWIDVLFLWGNDTTQWCECPRCRALEPDPDRKSPFGGLDRSATYCRLVKEVERAVRAELPGRRLGFNHYYNLEAVPADRSALPPATVLSAVDAYRQCDRHAFDDPNCPAGKAIAPLARAWGPHYPDTINWTYYWSWNFMKGLPLPMAHKIGRDFRLLKALGLAGNVDNVSLQPSTAGAYDARPGICVTDHWRYNALNFHVYARAAWDPGGDVDAWVADFIAHYYGPAARPMARFWRRLEEAAVGVGRDPAFQPDDAALADPKVVHGWLRNVRHLVPNRRVFDELEGHLREARHHAAAAYDKPLKAEAMPYLERVQLLERALAGWPHTKAGATYPHR